MAGDITLNSDSFRVVNLVKISVTESTSLKGTNCLSVEAILVIFLLYSRNVSAREIRSQVSRSIWGLLLAG